ncbi:ARM repeat-containing protein [Tuber magnatum]|uniref:ARM repeat-containing protein n=1 Tax=Tuber magnatum TaxID=42249 RepID=A0A317SXF0_9PEZI|nr:ARM repeat-containing protein [Tuber magnatum]
MSAASRNVVPLSPQFLFEALQAASSQSQELVKHASAQLKDWETRPGYWSLLQDAFFDRSLAVEIRWLAIITLKQGVDKYWRKTANKHLRSAISKDEKAYLRSRLLSSSIDEPHHQLALQNAVIVAKVARLEYPLDWPEVFTELTSIIRDASQSTSEIGEDEVATLRLKRSLSMMLHVVKELATGRLVRTKTNLQSVTPEVFKALGGVYVRYVEVWHSLLDQQPAPTKLVDSMTVSLLTLKVLRRLIVAGYEFPNRVAEVRELWSILSGQVWAMFEAERQIPPSEEAVSTLLKKHVINIGKLFLEVGSSHAAAFALLPDTLRLLGKYWEVVVDHGNSLMQQSSQQVNGESNGKSGAEQKAEGDRTKFRQRVALQGMLLFRNCLRTIFNPVATFKYRHKAEKDETKEATTVFKTQLFTPETVTHCMEVLVTKYFVIRPSDLAEWEEDPEGWSERWENAVESWEFLIRPCAEKLFMDLVLNFKETLGEPLMRVFSSVSSDEKSDVLIKDAIYTAVGLAAPVLHPALNFDQFMHNTLVKEIQIQQPGYNILRRRIAILIGQWVSVNISRDSRPTIYQITQHLLNREDPLNDLVVRLSAARNLKRSVDEWEFGVESFLPYVDDLFSKLMSLINEVEQTEVRMGLLDVIGVVVERLEHRIAPYAESIITILPPLWEQTGDEHLFKQAILTILTKLVSAMKDKSLQYHHMVIPLIRFSVEPGSGMQVYLLEDALDLWEAAIRATPAPAPQGLLDLVSYLLPCVELGTQTLRKVLDIIESYVILAPREMIEVYRAAMFDAFASLQGTLKPEVNGIVTNIVEVVIRAAGALGGEQALSVVGSELIRSGFLPTLLEGIEKSHEAHQTTGPNKRYAPLDAIVMTDHFSVLARMVLASPTMLAENVRVCAERKGRTMESDMEWILEEWFRHFGNIGHPKQRKLGCIALTKLLETNQGWILKRLQDLMTVWTDVVTELQENQGPDALIYWEAGQESVSEDPETAERRRRKELFTSDPAQSVDIAALVKHHLTKAQNENGGPEAFRNDWVANVDGHVLADFGKLGIF